MPAAGYRHEASGALTNVGVWGLCHASSSYASGSYNSGYLNFNASNVNPLNNANRASALSVRCVQASAGAVFYPSQQRIPARSGGGQGLGQSGRADSAIHWLCRSFPTAEPVVHPSLCRGDTEVSPAHSIQRLPLTFRCGQPQPRDGSLECRRHVRLRLVLVVLRIGQQQCGQSALSCQRSDAAERKQPGQRIPRALRPASAAVFVIFFDYI